MLPDSENVSDVLIIEILEFSDIHLKLVLTFASWIQIFHLMCLIWNKQKIVFLIFHHFYIEYNLEMKIENTLHIGNNFSSYSLNSFDNIFICIISRIFPFPSLNATSLVWKKSLKYKKIKYNVLLLFVALLFALKLNIIFLQKKNLIRKQYNDMISDMKMVHIALIKLMIYNEISEYCNIFFVVFFFKWIKHTQYVIVYYRFN